MNFLVLKYELLHGLEPELRGITRCIPTFGEFVSPMSALLHIHIIYRSINLISEGRRRQKLTIV